MSTTEAVEAPKKRKKLVADAISFIARFGLAIIWIVAGLTKVGDRVYSTQIIDAYEIFTKDWSFYLGLLIGPLEIGGGLLLLFGLFLKQSATVNNIVLVLFIIATIQAWLRGLEISCGCFGPVDVTNYEAEYAKTIIRDIFLIFLGWWMIRRPFTKWAVYP